MSFFHSGKHFWSWIGGFGKVVSYLQPAGSVCSRTRTGMGPLSLALTRRRRVMWLSEAHVLRRRKVPSGSWNGVSQADSVFPGAAFVEICRFRAFGVRNHLPRQAVVPNLFGQNVHRLYRFFVRTEPRRIPYMLLIGARLLLASSCVVWWVV
jgi:hypothetical protein